MEDFADQVARKTREARQAETVRTAKEAAEKAALEQVAGQMRSAAAALAAVLRDLGTAPQCELVEQRYERNGRLRRRYVYHHRSIAVGWLIAFEWSAVTDIGSWADGEILTNDGRILLFAHMHGSIRDLVAPARVIYSPNHSSEVLCDVSGPDVSHIPTRWGAKETTEHLAELAARHGVAPALLRDPR